MRQNIAWRKGWREGEGEEKEWEVGRKGRERKREGEGRKVKIETSAIFSTTACPVSEHTSKMSILRDSYRHCDDHSV